MNVSELIEALKEIDPEIEVMTEGCDCWGDILTLRVYPDDGDGRVVLLQRSEHFGLYIH